VERLYLRMTIHHMRSVVVEEDKVEAGEGSEAEAADAEGVEVEVGRVTKVVVVAAAETVLVAEHGRTKTKRVMRTTTANVVMTRRWPGLVGRVKLCDVTYKTHPSSLKANQFKSHCYSHALQQYKSCLIHIGNEPIRCLFSPGMPFFRELLSQHAVLRRTPSPKLERGPKVVSSPQRR
jgi:hypothetical protein